MTQVCVLGGGSWGTGLAWILGGKGLAIRQWCRDPEQAAAMQTERENRRYLPGVTLPESVLPTSDLHEALSGAEVVVMGVPSDAVRETFERLRGTAGATLPIVLAAKGLERTTGRRLTEVAAEVLGAAATERVAVLSGPNLASEIVAGLPTATVIAGQNRELLPMLQRLISTPLFRVYTNTDVVGVELGGALKNPIAVAAGISDGLGYGANTKAALLTRGLAELTRVGVAAGARAETFSGLSGLGDLLATAHSPHSRNYRLGLALARGESVQQAREGLHQVAEGVPTTEAAYHLARRLDVQTPVLDELRRILFHAKPVRQAVTDLLSRPNREEGTLD